MATLFIDLENGNDDYGGTSFALLASGTNGRISSSTFSSSTANFPNDGSLINQYLSIFNGTIYAVYQITAWVSNTSLTIAAISGGTALANQSVDRQYYIGGRWKTITNGATAVRIMPGDDIRVMSSPDPTLVGNATFTSSKGEPPRVIASSTNASPISITSSISHGYSTGDTVIITGHTTNTNANGTWIITVTGTNTFTLDGSTGNGVGGTTGNARKISNCVIQLASAVTANIASFGNRGSGRTAWTASANITATLDTTDTKEGDVSDSIAVAAGFTTGKAAYKATGTLNLSGYQQISFCIKQTAGTTIIAGDISLRLCSDATGDTTVNTINIPGIVANSRWLPITVNLGSNLGNSIQSVALYVDTDRGAQTFLISNIIACKASSSDDSLNLQSLIGKNTVSEKWWATIQSINGTRIILDQDTNLTPQTAATSPTSAGTVRGYSGTSETASLYKRETIKTTIAPVINTTVQIFNDNGTSGNTINLLFGYDRTSMSNQTGETFMDGLNGFGNGLGFSSRSFLTVSNAGFLRYRYGIDFLSCTQITLSNIWITATSQVGFNILAGNNLTITNLYSSFNMGNGIFLSSNVQKLLLNNSILLSNGTQAMLNNFCSNNRITNTIANNNNIGFSMNNGLNYLFKNCTVINTQNTGFDFLNCTDNNLILECTTTNNANSASGTTQGIIYIKNSTLNEAIPVAFFSAMSNGRTILINNNGSTDNYIHYTEAGSIYNTTVVRYSNSGFAWALAPTSTTRSSDFPLDLPIAKIAVNANSLVTVKAWMRRTNTGLTTGLRIKGGQIAGVSSDITSYMTAAADTWEQVILNFTPTEIGVVEILAECYGGSTFTAYVDDISITQV
jgi:hypothetical protein